MARGLTRLAVGQQLEGEHVDLLLGLAPSTDHIPEIVMRERRFNAIAGIIGQ
jgi:ABC-type nitrate/sulfonate/bicarbonate transport system substrate-binding protein